MGKVSSKLHGLVGFCGRDQSLLFGSGENLTDACALVAVEPETLPQALVGHIFEYPSSARRHDIGRDDLGADIPFAEIFFIHATNS